MQTLYLTYNMKKATKKQNQLVDQQITKVIQDDAAKLAEPADPDASISHAPLTLCDMERLLTSMEERIVAKLSAQLSADREIIDQHHATIQHLETSLNDTQTRLERLDSKLAALSTDNEALKLKVQDYSLRTYVGKQALIAILAHFTQRLAKLMCQKSVWFYFFFSSLFCTNHTN